jgi:magnesium chelatase accessory protein
MRWENWPNAQASRFVDCRPHRWHVQVAGTGPTLLLLHGAGGATISFRDLLPALARDFRVVAPDLPGHGFTRMGTRQRQGLDHMAADLSALLAQEGLTPDLIAGHSAGGAVALRLATLLPVPPVGVVGINAALSPFPGMAGWLFPMMAKALAASPLTALAVSLTSSQGNLRSLLRGTGSDIDEEGVLLYRRLVADRGHVEGTLAMMAQWKLDRLIDALPAIDLPVLLLAAENDRAVPPEVSRDAAARLPQARVAPMPGLGHLAHEEAPGDIAARIAAFARELTLAV